MKVLHLSAVKNWGGGEKHIENLCLEMRDHHPEITNVILCKKDDLFEKSLKRQNIRHYTSPVLTNFDLRYALKIWKVCRKENIDLIHIHDPKALALAIAADKFFELPPFVFSKKTSFPIKNRKSTLYKYNYPKIRRVLCVSEESRRITSLSLEDDRKLKRIYHGFRPQREKTQPEPDELRKKLMIPGDKKIIGNIANHTWPKDLGTFIELAHHLIYIEERKDLFFVQIGNFDRETPKLQKKLQELRLEEYFAFYNFLDDASSFMPVFDVFVLTSQSEGLPNVLYEAAFYKTPIVSTDVGGICEMLKHQENALLAEAFNPVKLAEHVLFLLEDREKAGHFTERAYENLMNNFTTKQMAEKTLMEYQKILDGNHNEKRK